MTLPATIPVPVSKPAGSGLEWVKQGWRAFMQAPLLWVGLVLLVGILSTVVQWIPLVGGLALPFLSILLGAGLLLGCQALGEGRPLTLEHLFAVFKPHPARTPLLVLAAIQLGLTLLVMITVMVMGGASALGALVSAEATGGDPLATASSLGGGVLMTLLVLLLLMTPLVMLSWFAVPLVLFRGMEPWQAMKLSFSACLANLLSMLVLGVLLMLAFLAGMIPMGLGLLVVAPVSVGAWYSCYRDVFPTPVA